MNKIYKVIWSKVRNCYVAVSEITKRNGKSCTNVNCGAITKQSRVVMILALALYTMGGVFVSPQLASAASGVEVLVNTTINDAINKEGDFYLNNSNIAFTVTKNGEVSSISGTNATRAISGNIVTIDGGTVHNPAIWLESTGFPYTKGLMAGFSQTGAVSNNHVIIKNNAKLDWGGTNNPMALGGFSQTNNVRGNTVTIDGVNTYGLHVYGGYTHGGTAGGDNPEDGNQVMIKSAGESAIFYVYGGYSKNGSVNNNVVNIENGARASNVYGGAVSDGSGDVKANAVNVINGSVSNLSGGYSQAAEGNVEENVVTIAGGTYQNILGGNLYNASVTPTGNVKGNKVTISDATVTYVLGGRTNGNGNATNNIVTINSGSKVLGETNGGISQGGKTNNNEITINGNATVQNAVYGGSGGLGNASNAADGNTITITGSPTLSTCVVYGGYAYISASDNTINMLSSVAVKGLVGGKLAAAGTLSGNTLNVAAKNVTSGSVSGFQNMNFYLPADIAKGDTMLTVNGGSSTDVQGVTFGVAALSGVNLQKGDTVNLLVNSDGLTTDDTLKTTDSATLAKASFLSANSLTTDNKYELSISKKGEDTIIATVDNVTEQSADTGGGTSGDTSAVEEIKKSPVETRMGVVTMVNAGADLLAGQGMANAADAAAAERSADGGVAAARAGGFAPFAAVGLGNLRAKSGSHVDTKSIGLSLGFAREIENKSGKLLVGPVVEYGHGKYDSYQDNGITADGKSSYWGIGVIAKQTNHNGFYYEGSLRAGRTKSDYGSDSARPGNHVSYDSSATYWAAHLGAGKLFDMGHDNTLDVYGKYFYSHTGSDSTTIHIGAASEGVDFSAVNSHRLRIGTRLTHALNAKNKIYGGLAWQYEFNGDARAVYSVSGEAPSPSVKGSSGMLELGWQVKPGKSPMTIDLGVTGWVGKLRGIAANVQMIWTF